MRLAHVVWITAAVSFITAGASSTTTKSSEIRSPGSVSQRHLRILKTADSDEGITIDTGRGPINWDDEEKRSVTADAPPQLAKLFK
ncbi:hypothetical protein PsorP6_011392 [Peronosclerospora sorghi]|uniref:Uncharacterized protein n=1 Tax=Peronosclerospora sorghi TaxID=230839 RepID=A0ACC0WM30_9STRA|nr:hypothetical protein PsorP6_011392 [Peronosclerospora sorghi]